MLRLGPKEELILYGRAEPIDIKGLQGLQCPLCGRGFEHGDYVLAAKAAAWSGMYDWMHFECYEDCADDFPDLKKSIGGVGTD